MGTTAGFIIRTTANVDKSSSTGEIVIELTSELIDTSTSANSAVAVTKKPKRPEVTRKLRKGTTLPDDIEEEISESPDYDEYDEKKVPTTRPTELTKASETEQNEISIGTELPSGTEKPNVTEIPTDTELPTD